MKDKNNENKNWSVYEHVFPNGYRYIGITCQKPEKRWKKGRSYIGTYVGSAIKEYGWDNIQHNILETELSEFEAKCLEEYYICSYRTYIGFSDCKGYNMTLGGDNIISEESRKKISEANKGKTPWNKGIPMTEEIRKKISESNKGKKGLRGKTPWNKGIPMTEESRKKISESMKGKMSGDKNPMYGKQRTEEWKKRHSEVMKGKMSGENNPFYDKKHTEETRKKMSENHANIKGKNNPMYGKHHSEESRIKIIESIKGTHRVYHEDGTWHMER